MRIGVVKFSEMNTPLPGRKYASWSPAEHIGNPTAAEQEVALAERNLRKAKARLKLAKTKLAIHRRLAAKAEKRLRRRNAKTNGPTAS